MASDFASSAPPPDILRELEEIEQLGAEEVWEIARRYQIERRRRADDECQTVEVEVMRHRDLGWRIVATDADRNISASGNPDRNLNAVIHTVQWRKLDGPPMPPDQGKVVTFIDRCSNNPPSPNGEEGASIGAHYTNYPECNGAAMKEKHKLRSGDFYLDCSNCGRRVYE